MSEHIDKSFLTKRLEKMCDIVCEWSNTQRAVMCGGCLLGSAIEVVEDFPAIEVVRCKECYAYRRDGELARAADLDEEQYCALLRCEMPEDGFCSYGRSKSDVKRGRVIKDDV